MRSSAIRRTCARSGSRTKQALRGFASVRRRRRSVRLLRRARAPDRARGGRYCLVVPNKWMTAAYGRPLREFLAREAASRASSISRAAAAVRRCRRVPVHRVGHGRRRAQRAIRARARDDAAPRRTRARATGIAARARALAREPWHIDDAATTPRCSIASPRAGRTLGDVVPERPSRGVVTGCNRAFVIDRETRARLLADEPAAERADPAVRQGPRRAPLASRADRSLHPARRSRHVAREAAARARAPRAVSRRARAAPADQAARGTAASRARIAGTSCRIRSCRSRSRARRACSIRTSRPRPRAASTRRGELVPDTTVWILPSARSASCSRCSTRRSTRGTRGAGFRPRSTARCARSSSTCARCRSRSRRRRCARRSTRLVDAQLAAPDRRATPSSPSSCRCVRAVAGRARAHGFGNGQRSAAQSARDDEAVRRTAQRPARAR